MRIYFLLCCISLSFCKIKPSLNRNNTNIDTFSIKSSNKKSLLCEVLKQQVALNWVYDKQKNHYKVMNNFETEISTKRTKYSKYGECIKGMSLDEFVLLFGKYNWKYTEGQYLYFLDEGCNYTFGGNTRICTECLFLSVYVKENRVTDVECCRSISFAQ